MYVVVLGDGGWIVGKGQADEGGGGRVEEGCGSGRLPDQHLRRLLQTPCPKPRHLQRLSTTARKDVSPLSRPFSTNLVYLTLLESGSIHLYSF